ncbi:MAG: CCA tRNA nucleotidyltransferase, partial [Planctomycetota bacterium]
MNAPRLELRAAACELAALLVRAGYEAFFAGGCVRDHLLHITPRDYDIATNATPEQLRVLFPKARGVGEVFGVMLVRHAGHVIEVSTFREDGDYQDGRRPVAVRFVDAASDAHRRDFTINGIFQRPDTGE